MRFECISMRGRGCAALLIAVLMYAPEAKAWEAVTDGLPDQAVAAVDKSRQRFFLMDGGEVREYLCTTGQVRGDKQVRGDLKTPEGVYFVVRKRTERLDFQEYGGEAYILDYPNPVDRLRGKTGSGIWVHSRGRAITPFESRGCVVLNLRDIAEVGPELKRGTPVVIGEQAEIAPRKDAVRQVERRTLEWREVWRRGGPEDGFVAPERAASMRKAGKAGQGRVAFGPVRALEGPGYVVSWFAQRMVLPDGGVEAGIRRLYWERQGDGEYRIVGMAWAD